jgi:hypothetical protein
MAIVPAYNFGDGDEIDTRSGLELRAVGPDVYRKAGEAMSAGYSGSPLLQKLGVKEGTVALLLSVPPEQGEILGYPGFAQVETALSPGAGRWFDYVHVFERDFATLAALEPALRAGLKADGMLWISWPKRASKVPTDITEDRLRDIFLPVGLVDVKVAAIDGTWSGLKFVFRKEIRPSL